MSLWFSKNLGDPLVAGEALSHLEALAHAARQKAGEPPELALFVRQESDGRPSLRGACVLFAGRRRDRDGGGR